MSLTNHFYHRTIRRNVIAFGNLFNGIVLMKYDYNTFTELGRLTVPLQYSENEHFIQRLQSQPDLPAPIQIKLPMMSFEMTSLVYDKARKLSMYNEECITANGTATSVHVGAPYNIGFSLYIYVRNIEDGAQIVEQILPYFNPDYTVTMNFVDDASVVRNVPVILDNVSQDTGEDGPSDTVRLVTWRLDFTMKTYFFGPVDTNRKLIKHVTANTITGNTTTGKTSVSITVDPDPLDASPESDYGYTEVVTYYDD